VRVRSASKRAPAGAPAAPQRRRSAKPPTQVQVRSAEQHAVENSRLDTGRKTRSRSSPSRTLPRRRLQASQASRAARPERQAARTNHRTGVQHPSAADGALGRPKVPAFGSAGESGGGEIARAATRLECGPRSRLPMKTGARVQPGVRDGRTTMRRADRLPQGTTQLTTMRERPSGRPMVVVAGRYGRTRTHAIRARVALQRLHSHCAQASRRDAPSQYKSDRTTAAYTARHTPSGPTARRGPVRLRPLDVNGMAAKTHFRRRAQLPVRPATRK